VLAYLRTALAKLLVNSDARLNADELRRLAARHAAQPSYAADLLAAAEQADALAKLSRRSHEKTLTSLAPLA